GGGRLPAWVRRRRGSCAGSAAALRACRRAARGAWSPAGHRAGASRRVVRSWVPGRGAPGSLLTSGLADAAGEQPLERHEHVHAVLAPVDDATLVLGGEGDDDDRGLVVVEGLGDVLVCVLVGLDVVLLVGDQCTAEV